MVASDDSIKKKRKTATSQKHGPRVLPDNLRVSVKAVVITKPVQTTVTIKNRMVDADDVTVTTTVTTGTNDKKNRTKRPLKKVRNLV